MHLYFLIVMPIVLYVAKIQLCKPVLQCYLLSTRKYTPDVVDRRLRGRWVVDD